jgi:divalent metal cation (Fe/Co/Zn/Cd) transporter
MESTLDIFSSFLVWAGLRVASLPPDETHPYGHGKAEALSTFGVVGFLLISATLIAYNGIQNLFIDQILI